MLGNYKQGKLELIIGCMFSGKSTELIKRIRKHKLIQSSILIITHKMDERYQRDCVITHDQLRENSQSRSELLSLLTTREFEEAHVIFIEEAQFFDDLFEFCTTSVDLYKKHLIVTGLDGDFKRNPFGQILNLIPMADSVDRLTAICSLCKDGTLAIFSKRLVESEKLALVGGIDKYLPVCRMHYHA
jgi:thymidine kinase